MTNAEVVKAAHRTAGTVYTASALEEAALLLESLYFGGSVHGIHAGDWAGQSGCLSGLSLRVLAARYRRENTARCPDEIRVLHKRLEAELDAQGTRIEGGYRGRLLLPRLAETPPWGWSGEAALTVGFTRGEGWTLRLAQEHTPVVDVVAPPDKAPEEVAELVAEILKGRREDPLSAPPSY